MRLYYIGIYNANEPQHGMRRALKSIATEYAEMDWHTEIKRRGKDFGKYLVNTINQFGADVVFFQIQTPDIITPEIAKQITAIKINWTGDVRENIDWYIKLAPYMNVTLFTNLTDVKKLQLKGLKSDFLQVSVDDAIYKPNGKYIDFAPFVFFGNNYKDSFPLSDYRYKIVTQLKRKYGNQFAIFGNGWGGIESGNLNYQQEKEAMILRGAKIALSISHFNYERYFSDRLLRAMFCGCTVVSHNYKGIEVDFSIGKDIFAFDHYEELTTIVDTLLSNDLTKYSNAAYENAISKFSYNQFNENLKQMINKYK